MLVVDTCFLYVRIKKEMIMGDDNVLLLFMGIFDCLKRLNR